MGGMDGGKGRGNGRKGGGRRRARGRVVSLRDDDEYF